MPYSPPNTKWYLAEVVMEFDIEGDPKPLVHINSKLIRADSPEEALRKAQSLGKQGEIQYENTDYKRVVVRFRGLRDLYGIDEELEDGAEILYEEKEGLSEAEISALVKERDELAVFREDP